LVVIFSLSLEKSIIFPAKVFPLANFIRSCFLQELVIEAVLFTLLLIPAFQRGAGKPDF